MSWNWNDSNYTEDRPLVRAATYAVLVLVVLISLAVLVIAVTK